ncbi:F0F1 ATP synthase subunit A [Chitinophaga niabensis]|uniref:ATP synthase subunit a n=1 Tax=Chitinophaga niabensis TaxID=536979 RepID=A0A1N6J8P5_9BACT|nr:F0F1 ATP synthase subunit A [Chitinophaga niabensis]SIO40595.1 ATP synthase F0 subcomplex A subunit [Chitinophaga niabensis]
MISFNRFKYKLVALIMVFSIAVTGVFANGHEDPHATGGHEKKEKFNAKEVILGHVKDAHDWHVFSIGEFHATVPLPVIIYSKTRGLSTFSSSRFNHGHDAHDGYRLVTEHYMHEKGLSSKEYTEGTVIAVDANDTPTGEKIYDLSFTKNIAFMLLGAVLLIVLMLNVAKSYRIRGSKQAPKGFQSLIEPVIIFMRDEVVKPNIPGVKGDKYVPFILTIFFFILINNLLGLLPGSANVMGNIAVTAALALISFVVMMASTNKYFWGHIFNPPVPGGVKVILAPVELIGVFTKPISLMIRLFANILAGHIIILSIISLVFIFGSLNQIAGYAFLPITIAFNIVMMMLELLVAFIQAFIFANLTAVFIGQAMEHTGDHHH